MSALLLLEITLRSKSGMYISESLVIITRWPCLLKISATALAIFRLSSFSYREPLTAP